MAAVKDATGGQSLLSETIKKTHSLLRSNAKNAPKDTEKVWQAHKSDVQSLQNYAIAMEKLSRLWKDSHSSSDNRVEWCRNVCKEYFNNGGIDRAWEKDLKTNFFKLLENGETTEPTFEAFLTKKNSHLATKQRKEDSGHVRTMLDVGSCFNPFQEFKDEFDVLAIDLCPASSTGVYQADFLEIIVKEPERIESKDSENCERLGNGEAQLINKDTKMKEPSFPDQQTRLSFEKDSDLRKEEIAGPDRNDSTEIIGMENGNVEEVDFDEICSQRNEEADDVLSTRRECEMKNQLKSIIHNGTTSCNAPYYISRSVCDSPRGFPATEETLTRNGKDLTKIETSEHIETRAQETVAGRFKLNLTQPITQLPADFFEVIIFSLLLSYLPTPKLRWDCCIKASRLLSRQGLLLIIESDSANQNRNSRQIKSWKNALASIGFVRYKYEKLAHLHCQAFRKSLDVVQPPNNSDMMFIPQDFHDEVEDERLEPRHESTNKEVSELFATLPIFDETY